MVGDVAAYGLQAAAVAVGSLLVVQPLLVCGLLVALPLNARWTGRSIRRREWVAAILLSASLAVFLIEAAPSGGISHASVANWLRVTGPVVLLMILAVATASVTKGHVRAALLGFAAGGLFGITAALTKTFVDQIQHGVPYTASHWEVYALALLSVTGILFTQHGFQASSLSASLPALEATEPVVAAVVGLTLLHEHLNGRTVVGDGLVAASILTALTCVVLLAESGVAMHDARPRPHPIPRSPRVRVRRTHNHAGLCARGSPASRSEPQHAGARRGKSSLRHRSPRNAGTRPAADHHRRCEDRAQKRCWPGAGTAAPDQHPILTLIAGLVVGERHFRDAAVHIDRDRPVRKILAHESSRRLDRDCSDR
jgi:drug/metabolite transporter (DMT)-like permease